MKKLSVVIVSYNVKYYLEQCLDSLLRALQDIEAEVLVVDNHSHDGSVDYLRRRFADVNFIACNHNNGFAHANNIAIKQAEGEYVLLLNPDTLVGEHVLINALQFMDAHPRGGALGVKMLTDSGSPAPESRRGLPRPMTAFYKMCGLCAKDPRSKRFGRYYMGYLPWDKPAKIDVVSGAFCLLRKQAIDEAGLLDEDFFMYGEDIDLSYRIQKKGYDNWYLPEEILHYKGESTQKSSFRYVHVFYGAMLIFLRKHFSHLSFWIGLPIKAAICVKAVCTFLQMNMQEIRKYMGFSHQHRTSKPEYVFIGHAEMIAACQHLCKNQGLSGEFHVGDKTSLPQGHLMYIDRLVQKRLVYAVYDVKAFSYATILSRFAQQPHDNIKIGIFHPDRGILITGEDIIR